MGSVRPREAHHVPGIDFLQIRNAQSRVKNGTVRMETKREAEPAGAKAVGSFSESETMVCPEIAGRFFSVEVGAGTAGIFSGEELVLPAQHLAPHAQQLFFAMTAAGAMFATANTCAATSAKEKIMAASFFTMSVSTGGAVLTNRLLAIQCHFLAAASIFLR